MFEDFTPVEKYGYHYNSAYAKPGVVCSIADG